MIRARECVLFLLIVFAASAETGCSRQSHQGGDSPVTVDLANLAEGELLEAKWGELPVVIYHRTAKDIANLRLVEREVYPAEKPEERSGPFRSVDENFFIAVMVSPFSKCKVKYAPPREEQPTTGKIWLGGFICPCRDIPYDLAGRTIKPGKYNPSGWSTPSAYLELPPYQFDGAKVTIGK